MLSTLENLIKLARERKSTPVEGSYTNKLLTNKALSKAKVLEEVNELNDEINKRDEDKSIKLLSREAADVLYVSVGHLLALRNEGLEAMYQVSKKNNNKTKQTHFFDKKEKKVKKLNI